MAVTSLVDKSGNHKESKEGLRTFHIKRSFVLKIDVTDFGFLTVTKYPPTHALDIYGNDYPIWQ